MGTEMASREDMQQIIMETAERKRNHATLRLLEAQQVDRRPPLPLSESGPVIELVSSAGGESTAELWPAQPTKSSHHRLDPFDHRRPRSRERGAQLENVALRQENVALEEGRTRRQTFQKAVRTLTRTLCTSGRASSVRSVRLSGALGTQCSSARAPSGGRTRRRTC